MLVKQVMGSSYYALRKKKKNTKKPTTAFADEDVYQTQELSM